MSLEGAIAAHRFGLGARPGEIDRASANPKAWLMAQIDGPAEQPKSTDGQPLLQCRRLLKIEQAVQDRQVHGQGPRHQGRSEGGQRSESGRPHGARAYLPTSLARASRWASPRERPFAERLVWFWSNHFTVSAQRPGSALCRALSSARRSAPYQRHVRGHAVRRLHASGDADLSHQFPLHRPGFARRRQIRARASTKISAANLLELHTLGVDGGYTQADVIAMAKMLTGWSVYGGRPNGFGFYAGPSRARRDHFARQDLSGRLGWRRRRDPRSRARSGDRAPYRRQSLRTHFIGDDPPAASVTKLEKTFQDTRRQSARARGNGGERCGRLDAATEEDAHADRICDRRDAACRMAAGERHGRSGQAAPPHHLCARKQMGQIALRRAVAERLARRFRIPGSVRTRLFDRIEWAKEVGNLAARNCERDRHRRSGARSAFARGNQDRHGQGIVAGRGARAAALQPRIPAPVNKDDVS